MSNIHFSNIEKLKKLKFILFFISVFSFSQNIELYVSESVIISGFQNNITFIPYKIDTFNRMYLKNETLFTINYENQHNIELVNIIENKNVFKTKALVKHIPTLKTKAKNLNNIELKELTNSFPSLLFGKNSSFNALLLNSFGSKYVAKYFYIDSKYVFEKIKNNNIINYKETSKKYLHMYEYTSRPPPLYL